MVTANEFCQPWLKTRVRLCFLMHRIPSAKPCIKEGNMVLDLLVLHMHTFRSCKNQALRS